MEHQLLPHWRDDAEAQAVVKLLKVAFNQDAPQSPCAAEILLACSDPVHYRINVARLDDLDPVHLDWSLTTLKLNASGHRPYQVLHEGRQLLYKLGKLYPPLPFFTAFN